MKLKVGMIGCGRMAGYIDDEVKHYPAITLPFSHAAAFSACEETEIVAACALHRESTERFCRKWGVERSYLDYQEMIEKEKPDIVSITTHADVHAPVAIFAAEHGVKGIYCEKPVALSLEEADRAVAACDTAGAKLLIGHLRRYHPAYVAAFEYVRSGELGNLVAINTTHTGELFHTGTHNLDLLNMAASIVDNAFPEFVQATLDLRYEDRNSNEFTHDLEGVGMVRYSNGITGYVHARGTRPPIFDQEFICEDGLIRVYNNGVDWETRRFELFRRELDPENPQWENVPPVSISKRIDLPFTFEPASMTLEAVKDLVAAVRYDRPVRSSGLDGTQAMEIGIGFLLSDRSGGKRISIPVDDRTVIVHAR